MLAEMAEVVELLLLLILLLLFSRITVLEDVLTRPGLRPGEFIFHDVFGYILDQRETKDTSM